MGLKIMRGFVGRAFHPIRYRLNAKEIFSVHHSKLSITVLSQFDGPQVYIGYVLNCLTQPQLHTDVRQKMPVARTTILGFNYGARS
jgi:hypothetical protein